MAEALLYQSVIQKLGQLNPNDLSQLDAFLSTLIGQKKPKKSSKKVTLSPVDCLEQLAKEGGISSIENPVEWQPSTSEDGKLPFLKKRTTSIQNALDKLLAKGIEINNFEEVMSDFEESRQDKTLPFRD